MVPEALTLMFTESFYLQAIGLKKYKSIHDPNHAIHHMYLVCFWCCFCAPC